MLVWQLVQVLSMGGQVDAPRSGVGQIDQCAVGKFLLDVKVPLLGVGVRIIGDNSSDIFPEQSLLETRVATRRLKDSGRERITQTIERREPVVEGRYPGCTDGIDEIVVRGVASISHRSEARKGHNRPELRSCRSAYKRNRSED